MSRWPETVYTTLSGRKVRFFYCCWTFCACPDLAPPGWEQVERCQKCRRTPPPPTTP